MFAEKIHVAKSVDDINVRVFVFDRTLLREDGNAALFLEIIGIHHAGIHLLVFTESAGLTQQLVHQRGFAMVNVGNDGDVAQGAVGV